MAQPAWVNALLWVGFPVLGAATLWLLKVLAGWLLTLPWVPFQGPLKLIDSVPDPYATVGALVIGVIGGLVVAFIAQHESLVVAVSDAQVTLTSEGASQRFGREAVQAVFLDGKQFVMLGRDTAELVRRAFDLPARQLAEAFRSHGYPWLDEDPHKDEFQRWVPDTPDLSASANAFFRARERALGKSDSAEDVAELRKELAKLGIVVRDEKKRQYWRRTSEQAPER
ncbi:hypothetical protein GCM10017673_22970 [Streptosporangium violaceochromogenes]|nr:hypothetical protein GCM10017673_22970 [Streptosporangium violaceochromogenes]